MSERPKEHKKASAQRRLAAALRDNLRRRKGQAKGRQEARKEGSKGTHSIGETSREPHDSAGIGAEK